MTYFADLTPFSAAERETLSGLAVAEQRRLACAAVEQMVARSAHAWARPALDAARAGRRDWHATVPEQFEHGVLLEALGMLSFLMDDRCVTEEPEQARYDFLDIVERSRDTGGDGA